MSVLSKLLRLVGLSSSASVVDLSDFDSDEGGRGEERLTRFLVGVVQLLLGAARFLEGLALACSCPFACGLSYPVCVPCNDSTA